MDNMKKNSGSKCNKCEEMGRIPDCEHCPHSGASDGVWEKKTEDMHMGYGFNGEDMHQWKDLYTRFPTDSLMGLLMQSGTRLFAYHHADTETEKAIFSGLTEDEQAKLKEILEKLLESWNNYKDGNF